MSRKAKSIKKGYGLEDMGRGHYRVTVYTGRVLEGGKRERFRERIKAESKEAAVKRSEELRDFYRAGLDVDLGKQTVREYVFNNINFREQDGEISPQTAYDRKKILERYVFPTIGDIALAKLTTSHMSKLLHKLKTERLARGGKVVGDSQIKHCWSALNVAFEYACEEEAMRFNPISRMRKRKRSHGKRVRTITVFGEAEMAKFIGAVNKIENTALQAAVSIALHTGMRKAEILGLQWGDISGLLCGSGSTVSVNRSLVTRVGEGDVYDVPKTENSIRSIPINPTLNKVLLKWRNEQATQMQELGLQWEGNTQPDNFPVITDSAGEVMKINYLSKLYRTFLKSIDMYEAGQGFHLLRHVYASYQVKRGMDWVELSQRLGHSNPSFTMDVYSHCVERQVVSEPDPYADIQIDAQQKSIVEENSKKATSPQADCSQPIWILSPSLSPLESSKNRNQQVKMVPPAGIEPATPALGELCSIP